MSEGSWLIEAHGIGYRQGGRWWLPPTLSLLVAPGQVAVLEGAGGSGKSTALRLLAGLLPLSAGTAAICGFDLRRQVRRAQRLVGYLPDQAVLAPDETPRQLLTLYAALGRVARSRRKGVVSDLLELFDLTAQAETPLGRLTPSARQAVHLARALVADPRLVLLDEPLLRLDQRRAGDLLALVDALAQMGKGVLVATGDASPWLAHGYDVVARLGAAPGDGAGRAGGGVAASC